jgi:hypothetical protein
MGAIVELKTESSLAGYSPDRKDLSAEAEESPLLTSLTRKRLLKTLRGGEDFVFAAVEISGTAAITCSSE